MQRYIAKPVKIQLKATYEKIIKVIYGFKTTLQTLKSSKIKESHAQVRMPNDLGILLTTGLAGYSV